jgi:hypothetical protein
MNLRVAAIAASVFALALADEGSDRSKISGAWQLENASSGGAETWVIEEKPDAIHITESRGDQKLADFDCNTVGRECDVKESGKAARVSLWFSGPKLIQLMTRGSDVVKRRYAIGDNGDTMEVEIIPIVPPGKTEAVRFKRVQVSAARQ